MGLRMERCFMKRVFYTLITRKKERKENPTRDTT